MNSREFDARKPQALFEYNTMDLRGRPVDMSKRHPVAKQLDASKDAKIIADYMKPEFVLNGWTPIVQ